MRGALAALLTLVLALALAGSAGAFYGPVDVGAYQALAVGHWQATPCGGAVTIQWAHEPAEVNARSTWWAPSADPTTYTDCVITFSLDRDWSIEMLCTVVIHEYGHLTGHPHVADPADLMSPYYEDGQAPECVNPIRPPRLPEQRPGPPPRTRQLHHRRSRTHTRRRRRVTHP